MNCFDGIVGIKDLDSSASIYLNDLRGITTELADYLKSTDNVSLSDFWANIKARAYLNLLGKFKITFYKYFSVYCEDREDIENYIPNILCNYKYLFDVVFANVCALEIMYERVNSFNLNYYTTHNIDTAKELQQYYQEQYIETFENAFKAVKAPDEIEHKKNYPNSILSIQYRIP